MDAWGAHTYCGKQGSTRAMNIFKRPAPPPNAGDNPRRYSMRPPMPDADWIQPWPRVDATLAAIIGLIITAFALASGGAGQRASELARIAAYGVGGSLFVSVLFEARSGLKNVVRADLVGLLAFYYLTLYEFLFPQPYFDNAMREIGTGYNALWALLVGFSGIMIGRHFVPRGRQPFEVVMTRETPSGWLIVIFWGSFILGYLHMLIAVNGDIPKLVDFMTRERFAQPWGRGKFGDWKALINELSLLLYFIPPLTGLVLARRDRFSMGTVVAMLMGFAWTLFYGFTTGTRSLMGAYLVTFMIAFAFAAPAARRRETLLVGLAMACVMAFSTGAMLQMRTVGFQKWWRGEFREVQNRQSAAVFVDDNLLAVAKIAAYFPDKHPYLGGEIPWLAIVRPIPRAIWSGKPIGLSVSVEEDVFKLKGLTISSTFVGEGYMSGGLIGVACYALVLGALAGFWNRMASPRNTELGILIYSSGFFAVVITMRSIMTLTTALLTPAAGILFGMLVVKGARRVLSRRPPPSRPMRPPR
jgi:hypothetical protein